MKTVMDTHYRGYRLRLFLSYDRNPNGREEVTVMATASSIVWHGPEPTYSGLEDYYSVKIIPKPLFFRFRDRYLWKDRVEKAKLSCYHEVKDKIDTEFDDRDIEYNLTRSLIRED